ncbi:MAG: glycosyltransferase family 4 protein [Bacteroidota bacterium]
MNKHRVLHVLTSEAWGGLEYYACTLAVALHKAGVESYFACNPQSRVGEFIQAHGLPCLPLYRRKFPHPFDVMQLCRFIARNQISVVHSHYHSDVWMVSIALRCKALLRSVRFFHSFYMGIIPKRDFLHAWVYRRVDGFFVSSRKFLEEVKACIPAAADKVFVLPYGRDLSQFQRDFSRRAAVRKSLNIDKDTLLVGVMARIDPGKGIREFVESYLLLPDDVREHTVYLVLGEPTIQRSGSGRVMYEPPCAVYNEEIHKFVKLYRLEERIRFVGFQSDYIPFLDAMDVFVLPSHAETYSLSALDAMAMSLPVVGTNSGGTPEQIKDGVNGFLIEPKSAAAIAAAIQRYYLDPKLREAHGINGRRFVESNHDLRQTISRLLSFYGLSKVTT